MGSCPVSGGLFCNMFASVFIWVRDVGCPCVRLSLLTCTCPACGAYLLMDSLFWRVMGNCRYSCVHVLFCWAYFVMNILARVLIRFEVGDPCVTVATHYSSPVCVVNIMHILARACFCLGSRLGRVVGFHCVTVATNVLMSGFVGLHIL